MLCTLGAGVVRVLAKLSSSITMTRDRARRFRSFGGQSPYTFALLVAYSPFLHVILLLDYFKLVIFEGY